MSVDYWFPTVVYTEVLEPSIDNYQLMLDYVDNFHSEHPDKYTVTGDVENDYQLAHKPEFNWLNSEVNKHCRLYLEAYGLNTDNLVIFSSKAWPVVCNPELRLYDTRRVIEPHTHPNAHLSAIFYLQTDADSGGELTLHASPTHPIRYLPLAPFLERGTLGSLDQMEYKPVQNQLIIFPSSIEHEVDLYYGDNNRYSITYDLIVTGTEDLEGDNEMCTINPKNWMKLHD